MSAHPDSAADPNPTVEEPQARLDTDGGGLSSAEAQRRLASVGPNAIEERRKGLSELAPFFWGPIPWMIEVALVLSALLRHWADVAIVGILLVVNAGVGFWQAHSAADAVAALKRQLALRATVHRDGTWSDVDAAELVPGDVVRIRLGDIVPADVTLLDGGYLRIDQSALTGESLPVDRRRGESAYSGSTVVQGEMTAIVCDTGARTFFGKTARLVAAAAPVSHFQKAVLTIGDYLIWLSLALVAVLIIVELFRGAAVITLIQFALILTVAAIPGGHAGGAIGDHGDRRHGAVAHESHCHASEVTRGDGRHRRVVQRQDRYSYREQAGAW
jgi:H+-transporting ATPase